MNIYEENKCIQRNISGMNKVWYKHTMKYHSALKRKEILTSAAVWMILEDCDVVTYN